MRDTKAINKWMIDTDINPTKIGRALNVDRSLASNTIAGRKHNRKVLQHLIDNGCPVAFLDLPADMREAA